MNRTTHGTSQRRARAARPAAAVLAALVIAVAAAGAAYAGHLTSDVKSYTGCLTAQGGTLSLIREGDSPAKSCPSGSTEAHFSGGDITGVTVGTGLTGGGTNGTVTIALDAKYGLRQDCSTDQVLKWNGTEWACAADNDTTYSAGTGLSLSSNQFSVSSSYRLPQGCTDGQSATSNGSGSWSCTDAPDSAPLSYLSTASGEVRMVDGESTEVVRLRLPAGKYFVSTTGDVTGADLNDVSSGYCYLNGPGSSSDSTPFRGDHSVDGAPGEVAMQSIFTLPTDGSVYVDCLVFSSDDQADASDFELIAIAVR